MEEMQAIMVIMKYNGTLVKMIQISAQKEDLTERLLSFLTRKIVLLHTRQEEEVMRVNDFVIPSTSVSMTKTLLVLFQSLKKVGPALTQTEIDSIVKLHKTKEKKIQNRLQ